MSTRPTKWEFIEAEYLSHDAPGYTQLLTAGGIMDVSDEDDPHFVIEGEIEPKVGKLIVRAVNCHDELQAALLPLSFCDPETPPRGVAVADWKPAILAARAAVAKSHAP